MDGKLTSRLHQISSASWRNLAKLLVLFGLGAALMFWGGGSAQVTPLRIQQGVLALGSLGFLGYLAASTIRPLFVVLSGSLFAVAAGIIWGLFAGTALALMGSALSTVLVFFLARRLGAGAVRDLAGRRYAAFSCRARTRGFAFVFVATLGFLIPTDLVIAVAAASGVRLRTVVLAVLLGTIPGTAAMVALGASVLQPGRTLWWLGGGAVLVLTVLAGFLVRALFPRRGASVDRRSSAPA